MAIENISVCCQNRKLNTNDTNSTVIGGGDGTNPKETETTSNVSKELKEINILLDLLQDMKEVRPYKRSNGETWYGMKYSITNVSYGGNSKSISFVVNLYTNMAQNVTECDEDGCETKSKDIYCIQAKANVYLYPSEIISGGKQHYVIQVNSFEGAALKDGVDKAIASPNIEYTDINKARQELEWLLNIDKFKYQGKTLSEALWTTNGTGKKVDEGDFNSDYFNKSSNNAFYCSALCLMDVKCKNNYVHFYANNQEKNTRFKNIHLKTVEFVPLDS